MWNENLHRTFAFIWKERYTCGGKKKWKWYENKIVFWKAHFYGKNFEKMYKQ